MDMGDDVPTPGEWHPWYEQYRSDPALVAWLQSDDTDSLCLPVPRALSFGEGSCFEVGQQPELRKRLVYSGPKEYHDRLMNPGLNWYVATDQYGRSVCGRPFAAPL